MLRRLLIVVLLLLPFDCYALDVTLTVNDNSTVARTDGHVSYGVPIPRSDDIIDVDTLGIFDTSVEQDAQFRVLARYDGTPSDTSAPIQMVLVDTQESVTADGSKELHLKDTGSGTASGTLASSDATHITVDTGPLVFKIKNTGGFNLFDDVQVDTTGNGDADTQLVSTTATDGINLYAGSTVYSSSNATPSVVEIEENGPLRCVIHVRGEYEDSSNNALTPPVTDTETPSPVEYDIRIIAYKDKAYVKLFYTMMSENFGYVRGDSPEVAHNVDIDYGSFTTTLVLDSSKTVEFGSYSDTYTTATYELVQGYTDTDQISSTNFSYNVDKDSGSVDTGQQFDGHVDVRDSSKGLMVAGRWFWQNWPKGVSVTDNVMDFYLWPDTATDHTVRGGFHESHEIIYNFHGSDTTFTDELAALRDRLLLMTSADYLATTNFIDVIAPVDITTNYTFPTGESLDDAIDGWNTSIEAKYNSALGNTGINRDFDYYRENMTVQWATNGTNIFSGEWMSSYGMYVFGDFPLTGTSGFPSLHYSWDYISLINGLRFSNPVMIEYGEQMARGRANHAIVHDDNALDIAHGSSAPESWYAGGHRYETGNARLTNGFARTNNSFNDPAYGSHSWTRGILLQYLLTGNEYYKGVIDVMATHYDNNFAGTGVAWGGDKDCTDDNGCWDTEETRQVSRIIEQVVGLYQVLGTEHYLDLAYDIFDQSVITNLEHKIDTVPQGYMHYTSPQNSCDQTLDVKGVCDAHVFYEVLQIKGLTLLYLSLKDASKTTEAAEVMAYMIRKATWMRDSLFTNWDVGDMGTVNGSNKYLPYTVYPDWKIGTKWVDNGQSTLTSLLYTNSCADLFAMVYEFGDQDIAWLNIARSLFKDQMMYQAISGAQDYVTIATTQRIKSLDNYSTGGYLKGQATQSQKPMTYLAIEAGTLSATYPSNSGSMFIGTGSTFISTGTIR